jgi:hypothetical protein
VETSCDAVMQGGTLYSFVWHASPFSQIAAGRPSRTRNQFITIQQEYCKARAVIAAQSQRLQSSFILLNPNLQHNSLITSQQAAAALPVLRLWI